MTDPALNLFTKALWRQWALKRIDTPELFEAQDRIQQTKMIPKRQLTWAELIMKHVTDRNAGMYGLSRCYLKRIENG